MAGNVKANDRGTLDLAVVILAAGSGKRMKSTLPKVLHTLAGQPMICHLLRSLRDLRPARTLVVVSPAMTDIADLVAPAEIVVQDQALGTGHAVMAARAALAGFRGDVLVTFADTPLLTAATMRRLVAARHGPDDPAVVVLGFRPAEAAGYARLAMDDGDGLQRIIEQADATPEDLTIEVCNSGMMAIDGGCLFALLDQVDRNNAQGEFYLTDLVALARRAGRRAAAIMGEEEELLGINSQAQLAEAEAVVQRQLRQSALENGVLFMAPESVSLAHDTIIGPNAVIEADVQFGPGVEIGAGARIKAHCRIDGVKVPPGAVVGPDANLAPGADPLDGRQAPQR